MEKTWRMIKRQKFLIFMSFPMVIWVVVFKYIPLSGWAMAFQNYKPGLSFTQQQWIGFKNFATLFGEERFFVVMRNTLAMSTMSLISRSTLPIILALFINEITHSSFKRTIQTISYLPHFLSWVIVASMFFRLLSPGGMVNSTLMSLGIINTPIQFVATPRYFWVLITSIGIWKDLGWASIIYLSAISGVNQELYESASVDGAGRFRKMVSITLPSIMPTIIVILIMNVGNIINIGFEPQMLFRVPPTREVADVLDLYVLDVGIRSARYGLGTAAGIFKSTISLVFIMVVNSISKKYTDVKVV